MLLKSVADYEALTGQDALTTAERDLIEAVREGNACYLCEDENPTLPAATDKTRIRADLLRLLITGGSKDCGLHKRGVTLIGGWIDGQLDLAYCTARGQMALDFCRFPRKPRLEQARFQLLSLQDSQLDQGLFAQGARIKGSLVLSDLTATGTIDLAGAQIGGQLACTGARLNGKDGMALYAQGVTVGQDLILRSLTATGTVDIAGAQIGGQLSCKWAKLDGKDGNALHAQGVTVGQSLFLSTLTATGTVAVNSAQIGGQLNCTGATLDGKGGDALNAQAVTVGQDLFLRTITATGTVDVAGAQIGGQLDCEGAKLNGKGGIALNAQRLRVKESFIFRNLGEGVKGQMNLTAAQVGDLVDDPTAWPITANDLILDGFTYDRIDGPTTLDARSHWLHSGSHWYGEFRPQPYTQLARVLRQMGHAGEARKVLIERERLLAHHRLTADRVEYQAALHGSPMERCDAGWIWLRMRGLQVWTWLTRIVAGYGYGPQRALYCALVIVPVFALLYFFFWRLGAMVPADAILLVSPEWAEAVAAKPSGPSLVWQGPAQKHFETFYSLPYALDVFLPIVDLGQQSTWSQTTETWWGWGARLTTWALQSLGYIITSLGLAAATGIIQRNQPD